MREMVPARLAQQLGISPKTLRAFLRRTFPRNSIDHGTGWVLTTEQVAAARQKFCGGPHIAIPTAAAAAIAVAAVSTQTARSSDEPSLRCYVRPGLDVLFVALNPPTQSANNGHWFSGTQSAFFRLLYRSELITADLPKATADELVFGTTQFNHKGASFGVTDLCPEIVEVNSGRVALHDSHVKAFIRRVRENEPRIVCIIHSKVLKAFNNLLGRSDDVIALAAVGTFTQPLAGCPSRFICNYFPNGNAIADEVKIDIFKRLRDAI